MSSLPCPDLDDRGFQDFVDDAKRLVQQRCPTWTDHNVSDPGVTLLEAFATVADQLTYRLNRVPDRLFVRFLELIGTTLFPASAARAAVTCWLTAPQRAPVRLPAGTVVATRRGPDGPAIGFSTVGDLVLPPVGLAALRTETAAGERADRTSTLAADGAVPCFSTVPAADDVLLVGLSAAAPRCVVGLRVDCAVEGTGVLPDAPPLVWEAWTDDGGWQRCEVERDGTAALNRPGDVLLHVPAGHAQSLVGGTRAAWLRARVLPAAAHRPGYTASPVLRRLTASTLGGTVDAVHAELVEGEVLGTAEGVPAQRLQVARTPVLPTDEPLALEVSDGTGWQTWRQVESFSGSGSADRHFVLDAVAGTVDLGPCVRLADGSIAQHGAVPARGATLRLRAYRTGGGAQGNVAAGALCVLRTSVPYVGRVENRQPARGGRDAEDVAEASVRGPLALRSRSRAVTAEDYEHLAAAAAPELARVHCLPGEAGVVRVLLVPAGAGAGGRQPFDELVPPVASLRRVADALEQRRVLGARVVVEPPVYRGLTVVARLSAQAGWLPEAVQEAALAALYRAHDPVVGGPDGRGWPFGRAVGYGEVFAVLQRVPGVATVDDLRLFPADPVTGVRGEAAPRILVGPGALVFSYDHQVRVTPCVD